MRKFYPNVIVPLFFFIACQLLPADGNTSLGFSDSPLSIKLGPTLSFPLFDDGEYYNYGPGGEISIRYKTPFLNWFTVGLTGGYTYSPVNSAPDKDDNSLSSLYGGASVGAAYEPARNIVLEADVTGGYWYGFLNSSVPGQTTDGSDPYLSVGLRISYVLVPWLAVGIEGRYRNFLGNFQDATLGLNFSYLVQTRSTESLLPGRPAPLKTLELADVTLFDVFPVFFKYYDDHPIGKAVLRNTGKETVQDIKINLLVKQYMDNPKLCIQLKKLDPGQQAEVSLFGLFTDKVLGISEGTKVSAMISVEASASGKSYGNEYVETIRLYDRNAMTWDDNRRAAAFVSAKDPAVLRFSKFVSGVARESGVRALDKNLLAAICMHEALALYGLNYVVDPNSSYQDFSKKKSAVDYLQFPSQTLSFKAGDCDDLSILNAALLESVGIETAFITIPGHIYLAFALDASPEEARKSFTAVDDLIFFQNKAWVPLEITSIKEGFLAAWQKGAREWREYDGNGEAKMYPMRSSWNVYEPVGYPTKDFDMVLPQQDALRSAFQKQLDAYIERMLGPQERDILSQIEKSQNDARLVNRLGLLYAQFGLYDKAVAQFETVLKAQEYWPALVNMGNIAYLRNDMKSALSYFGRASKKRPNESAVLLGQALASYALGDFARSNSLFEKLKSISPAVADKYAYLAQQGGNAARASETENGRVMWGEE